MVFIFEVSLVMYLITSTFAALIFVVGFDRNFNIHIKFFRGIHTIIILFFTFTIIDSAQKFSCFILSVKSFSALIMALSAIIVIFLSKSDWFTLKFFMYTSNFLSTSVTCVYYLYGYTRDSVIDPLWSARFIFSVHGIIVRCIKYVCARFVLHYLIALPIASQSISPAWWLRILFLVLTR